MSAQTATAASNPSAYQRAIFAFIARGQGDGMVDAVAGSGKTSTLVEAAKLIQGRAAFFAFNKHIAEELAGRLAGTPMRAGTIHSYGYRTLARGLGRLQVDDEKYRKLARARVEATLEPALALAAARGDRDAKQIVRERAKALARLADFARLTRTRCGDAAAVRALIAQYDLAADLDPAATPDAVGFLTGHLRPLLDEGLALLRQGHLCDYTDMVWGPLALGLAPEQYDWVFVDEAQDLNAAQRELVLAGRAPGGRMLFVGDERQAIMAFAGADARSYRAIREATGATSLPLAICYRCPHRHLELARLVVPHIEDRPGAPGGEVRAIRLGAAPGEIGEGALVLSRTTAPLVGLCIKLIQARKPARVRGRDIGKGLVELARTIEGGAQPGEAFLAALDRYEQGQLTRLAEREGAESLIEALRDRCEALRACYTGFAADTVDALCAAIEGIFADGRASIWLSTIHRAKGLEAADVYLLNPRRLPLTRPRQTAEEAEQEYNLLYVALTRSTGRLTCVHAEDEPGPLPTVDAENLDLAALGGVGEGADEAGDDELVAATPATALATAPPTGGLAGALGAALAGLPEDMALAQLPVPCATRDQLDAVARHLGVSPQRAAAAILQLATAEAYRRLGADGPR